MDGDSLIALPIAGAALLSSALSYLVNLAGLKLIGEKYIYLAGPLAEEFLKTGFALLFAVPILPVHVAFGILEAIQDLRSTKKASCLAALLAVSGHSLWGYTTVSLYGLIGGIVPAVFSAAGLHMMWNYLVLRSTKRETKG